MKNYLITAIFLVMPFFLQAQQTTDSTVVDFSKVTNNHIKASRFFYWPGTVLASVGILSLALAWEADDSNTAEDLAVFGGCALLASVPFLVPAFLLEKKGRRKIDSEYNEIKVDSTLDKPLVRKKMEMQFKFHAIPTGYSSIPVYSVGLTLPID